MTIGATVRLGLARAAEALLGDDPARVVETLDRWNDNGQPLLPWLPGPLLDALAPLGIEVPRTPPGRHVSRLLVGLTADATVLVDAVEQLRAEAMSTSARQPPDEDAGATEAELMDAVRETVTVLTIAYGQLSPLISQDDRDAVEHVAEHSEEAVAASAAQVDTLAVRLVGERPDRLHAPDPERPTIDLSAPWTYEPLRRQGDAVLPALIFLAVAVAAAVLIIWGVLNGTFP